MVLAGSGAKTSGSGQSCVSVAIDLHVGQRLVPVSGANGEINPFGLVSRRL
jgi:hypothetical protein